MTAGKKIAARVSPKGITRAALIFAVLFLLLQAVRSSVIDWVEVPSRSMEPTIPTGTHLLIWQTAYDVRIPFTRKALLTRAEPRTGEIVVFASPVDGVRLIKRIVAGPGDVVERVNGCLAINGHTTTIPGGDRPAHGQRLTLVNAYFMVGDNPLQSADSRTFGPIQRQSILGRANR